MTSHPRGVVYVAFDHDRVSVAFARNNNATVASLDYTSPDKDDINLHLLQFAKAIAPHLSGICDVLVYEDDPRSREAAQRQNFTKRAIASICHARGYQLRSATALHAEVLLTVTLPVDAPDSAYRLPPSVNAMRLAAWDRTANENALSFGNVVRRGDLRRSRSLTRFDELVGGAFRGRWNWHGFDMLRDQVRACLPMSLKAEGIA